MLGQMLVEIEGALQVIAGGRGKAGGDPRTVQRQGERRRTVRDLREPGGLRIGFQVFASRGQSL
jgi:hypothetical protein